MENMVQYIVAILVGLAVSIPVVVGLIRSVRQNVEEKRWDLLLKQIIGFMMTAEEQFKTGSVKKDWVLAMGRRAADEIGVPFDEEKVGAMIDAMVELSKQINVPTETPISSDGE